MAKNWKMDTAHSEVTFKARHMMISNVKGEFKNFDAAITTNGNDFSTAQLKATIDVNSIDTGNEQRDGHLKSADFFDAGNHASMEFVGTEMKKITDDEYELTGDLTIRGITKPITFKVEHGGTIPTEDGGQRAGFSLSGKLSRKEYDLSWNALLETGGAVVGDEIKFNAEAEFLSEA